MELVFTPITTAKRVIAWEDTSRHYQIGVAEGGSVFLPMFRREVNEPGGLIVRARIIRGIDEAQAACQAHADHEAAAEALRDAVARRAAAAVELEAARDAEEAADAALRRLESAPGHPAYL